MITPFVVGAVEQLVSNHVDYAAICSWELYQFDTYETHNTEPSHSSVEPGYSDDLIAPLGKEQSALGGSIRLTASAARLRVILVWPLPYSAVEKRVTLVAVASGGAKGVSSVEFLIDGKLVSTSIAPPYHAKFDPAGLGKRTAEIKMRANTATGVSAAFKSAVSLNEAKQTCDLQNG